MPLKPVSVKLKSDLTSINPTKQLYVTMTAWQICVEILFIVIDKRQSTNPVQYRKSTSVSPLAG